jgi:hypothetical protein
MPVYEVTHKATPAAKPRLVKAKNINGARAHAAADLDITRPSAERMHVLSHRGVKIEYAEGVHAEPQRDIEEPTE